MEPDLNRDDQLPPDPLLKSGAFIDVIRNAETKSPMKTKQNVSSSPVTESKPTPVDSSVPTFVTPVPQWRPDAAAPQESSERPDWLPEDWKFERRVRASGASAGVVDRGWSCLGPQIGMAASASASSSKIEYLKKYGLINEEEKKKKKKKKNKAKSDHNTGLEDWSSFNVMDPSISGRGAEPVYRDKLTGKRMSKDEFLKSQKKEKKHKEVKLEWGKGLSQKREAEAWLQEMEVEKNKPSARTRDSRKRQYRCSLQGILQTYNTIRTDLTKQHTTLLAKTPFKKIFKAIDEEPNLHTAKREVTLDSIIQKYSSSADAFRIGKGKGRYYGFETSDIKLIFGLTNGNREISFNMRKTWTSNFTARLFPGEKHVSVGMLKSKIPEISKRRDTISVEDTVRALCLLLIGSCLLCNTGTMIATGYYKCLDYIDEMSEYNWARAIEDNLRKSLKKNEGKDPKKVAGCTLFLLYWFCEHCTKLQPQNTKNPRFRRWNLADIKISAKQLELIPKNEFKQGALQPTEVEFRDIGVELKEDTKLITESTPGDREEDSEEEDEEEMETEEKDPTEDEVEEESEGGEEEIEEEETQHQPEEEELENLMKTLAEAPVGECKKEAEEMQREILKLHAEIKGLQEQLNIEEKKRHAIMNSTNSTMEKNKKLEVLEKTRKEHIQKQLQHIDKLNEEKDAQNLRMERMTEDLNFYMQRVRQLEKENFVLAGTSSEQISQINTLKKVMSSMGKRMEENNKELNEKKMQVETLTIAVKELETLVQFPDSAGEHAEGQTNAQTGDKTLQMPPIKRVKTEVLEDQPPTKKIKAEEDMHKEDI